MWMEKIIFILVFAIALYLSINVIQKFSIKFDLLSEIIKELKLGFINDIVISNSTVCPKNYESMVTNTFWPGSYKGCGCKNDDKSTFNFYPNYCPKLRECYSVEETLKKDFNFWKGYNICFRRSETDYAHMNVIKIQNLLNENGVQELSCSNSTHKICGIIDGKNHYLCMKRDLECPINEIKFVNLEKSIESINQTSNRKSAIIYDLILSDSSKEEKIKFDSGFKVYKISESNINDDNIQEIIQSKELKGEAFLRDSFDFDIYRDRNDKINSNYDKNFIDNENNKSWYNITDFYDKKYLKNNYKSKNDIKFKSFEDFKNSEHFQFNKTKLDILEKESKKRNKLNSNKSESRILQSTMVKFINPTFTQTYDNHKNNISTNITTNGSILIREGFYSLNLTDNFQLIFSKNEMSQEDFLKNNLKKIPVFFRTQLDKPCLDSFKNPSVEYYFPLMKNKFDYLCDLSDNKTEIVDESIETLDSLPLSEFYKYNNYFREIDNAVSQFNIDLSKKFMYLFTRNYLGWSSKCLATSPDSLQSFLKIEEHLNHLLIMNILHSFISIGGIIALGIFACFLSQYFELFFKFVNLGFCLLNLIVPIQIISNSNWIINLFTDEDGVFCGDHTLNILLIEVSNSCLEMQNSYIWILIITIFYSFIYIYMLYKWIKPFHQEYQNKIKNYMSLK